MKQGTGRPINVNFFVHNDPVADAARDAGWRKRLAAYYRELGLAVDAGRNAAARAPFTARCATSSWSLQAQGERASTSACPTRRC